MNLCICGCDQIVKRANRFINGHNTRVNNPMHNLIAVEKVRQSLIGHKVSKKTREKIRKTLKENYNNGYINPFKGKKRPDFSKRMKLNNPSFGGLSDKHKKKISDSMQGEKCYWWQGGKSFEPYSVEFNENLKELIRNRDNRICQKCGKTEKENNRKLDVHHINGKKKDCDVKNLISLCQGCHSKLVNRNLK